MKKRVISILVLCVMIFSGYIQAHAEKIDYEKYGKIAITVVKADYPGEPVTDYEFLGRKKLNQTDVEDSFQFTVKENGNPKKVLVKIRHSIANNKLLSLTVEEVKQ